MRFEIDNEGTLKKVIQENENETKIIVPSNIETIDEMAFSEIKNIEKIIFPDSLKIIGNSAFFYRKTLKSVSLPSSLQVIEEDAFQGTGNLRRITLPSNLKIIGEFAFGHCDTLKNIEIPTLITKINKGTFIRCPQLEKVRLNDRIETIDKIAFSVCKNLKNIKLPSSLKYINEEAFSYSGLRKIDIVDTVEEIEKQAFFNCEKLEKVKLSKSLKNIKEATFSNCHKLKRVILQEGIETIGDHAFYLCENIRKISLPSTVKTIGHYSFGQCERLKEIILPESLETIKTSAFEKCKSLKKIIIPVSVKTIEVDAFRNTDKIKEITLGNVFQIKQPGLRGKFLKHVYYNKNTKEILMSDYKKKLSENYKEIDYMDIINKFSCEVDNAIIIGVLFDEDKLKKMGEIKEILPLIINDINEENYNHFLKIIDKSKEFNNLVKYLNKTCMRPIMNRDRMIFYFDVFKLSYSLGIFSEDKIERQKACEFIKWGFDKKELNQRYFHNEFEGLKINGYNKEWAEFFMNKDNLIRLLELERGIYGYRYNGIISRIHNNFDYIKEFGRSNRGSQRYRKVTIEMAKEYFDKSMFNGINKDNQDIVDVINEYTHSQESFDDACSIREEYLKLKEEGKINDHILNEELKEIREDIIKDTSEILENLNETSNNKFSYEFLSKYDPKNFVLGKYCSCCAHIEGMGSGIMKASILHPDCQNLVIRDKEGRIIAKSTLYINRNQRYGVFNNVEINNNAIGQDDKEKIYLKYKEAVKKFVKKYNELNKDKPLTQINVGMGLNDLSSLLKKHERKSDKILKGINFSEYEGYEGDWQDEQYVIWSNEEVKKKR